MKNKKWISLAAAVVLAVTALPMGVFAAKKDSTEEKLTKVTLNEVAHSIFYAPQYVAIEEGYFKDEGLDLTLVTGYRRAAGYRQRERSAGFDGCLWI